MINSLRFCSCGHDCQSTVGMGHCRVHHKDYAVLNQSGAGCSDCQREQASLQAKFDDLADQLKDAKADELTTLRAELEIVKGELEVKCSHCTHHTAFEDTVALRAELSQAQERITELEADAVRFSLHLDQKDKALAANANEYKKVQERAKELEADNKWLRQIHADTLIERDQLKGERDEAVKCCASHDCYHCMEVENSHRQGFEACREALTQELVEREIDYCPVMKAIRALPVPERGEER